MSAAGGSGTGRLPGRLVLVRHGETDWNQERRLQGRTDNPLNGVGRAQARKAGRLLAADPWNVVVSSPLLRAVQTAHLIADAVGLHPAGTIPELIERDYGPAEGLALDGLTEPQLTAALGVGEPEQSVAQRGLTALRGMAAQFPSQRIIAIAHGTLIRLTLSELTGQRYPRVLNGEVVEVPLAALLAESAVPSDWG